MLSDPEKRAAYDRYGHAAFQNGGGGNPFTGGGFGGSAGPGGHLRRSVRRDVQHGRQRRPQGFAGAAWARSAVRPDAGVRRGGLRQGEGDHDPADGDVHGLQGHGRGEGQGAGDLYAVRRARAAEIPAGILFGGADLLGVRRDRDVDCRSVHDMQGRDAGADASTRFW